MLRPAPLQWGCTHDLLGWLQAAMAITRENRKQFKQLGFERIRLELLFPYGDLFKDGPTRLQAAEWVSEQEGRQRSTLVGTGLSGLAIGGLTLIAAAIGAWPVLKGWLLH
jgi:hypothetical protein